MKKYEITSLIEFMAIMQDISVDNKKFYYRGENLKYAHPMLASGYRNTQFPEELRHARKDYFREVGYSLDTDSRENFMAYSQHHGLPTELIDVTENPIVALYFACENNLNDDGMMYVIKNDGFIVDPLSSKIYDKEKNITSIQEIMRQAGNYFQESGGKYIRFQDSKFYRDMSSAFYAILMNEQMNKKHGNGIYMDSKLVLCKYILETHCKGVMQTIIHSSVNIYKNLDNITELMNLLDKYIKATTKEELDKFYFEFKNLNFVKEIKIFPEINSESPFKESLDEFDCKSLFSLFVIAYEIRDDKFPPFPLIIYKPAIIFDRLKNQQGAFLYQMSTYKSSRLTSSRDSSYENVVKNVIQEINCEYEITITNKEHILKELDNIGINRKFIYPDSDNIAHYVKNKYNI